MMKNKKVKDFSFAKRAASYDKGLAGRASRKFYNLILHEMELPSGAVVLDVGCGTGALLNRLADEFGIIGYGIDMEENMITEAKKKCSSMSFQVSRCDYMPFDDQSFDAVIACMAYHHFDNKAGFASEAARVLKPGGLLYVADPRFPWVIRKALNGVLRAIRVVGEFFSPKEMEAYFATFGFGGAGMAYDGYAQIVVLEKLSPNVCSG